MRIGPLKLTWLDVLLVFVPIGIGLELAHASPTLVFIASCLSIIPIAGWMGRATEHLAAHFGAGVGGLLNATFGNAAEMIIAFFALKAGLIGVVKASITGSIIGNILLVLGLSLFLGGIKHARQQFNRTASGLGSTLLALSAVGLVVPAIFHALTKPAPNAVMPMPDSPQQDLSLAIAIVLIVAYLLSLLFSLKTHKHLFAGEAHHDHGDTWSKGLATGVLVGSTILVAVMSHLLVGSVEHTAEAMGLSEVFIGVVLVAIVGNAAEHSSAVFMALRNRMDLSIQIAIGSGIQIALFVAPALLFISYALNPNAPMDLLFSPFEVIAVVLSVFVVSLVAHDGESHWMEGLLLLAVYAIIGIAFFYLPA